MRRLALLGTLLLAGCGNGEEPRRAATSTIDATLADRDGDGFLAAAAGEPLRDRTDLSPRRRPGRVLATFALMTDVHVRDEESPARVPFLDRYGGSFRSTFRPQEALQPHVLAATVRAINAQRPQATLVIGDVADNAQVNELAQARAVLDGGRVDPDSGGPGYDGVQDETNPDPLYYRPDVDAPRHPGILDAAQRPFRSPGLDAPWHGLAGNHDRLVAGEVAPDDSIDAIATGRRLTTALDPRTDFEGLTLDEATEFLLGAADREITVPADHERRLVRRNPFPGDRVVRIGGVDALLLDTTQPAGGRGRVTARQRAWLGERLEGPRPAVVVSHHRLDAATWAVLDGRALAALHGDTHRNRIRPRGRTWEVGTAALADHPMQARMVRVRGNGVLETWMVDHDGGGLAGVARELAHLDAQGGRPLRYAGGRRDRNVRLYAGTGTG